ncbi:hypothetical protein STEG23_009871 [Scotinomys teguina]
MDLAAEQNTVQNKIKLTRCGKITLIILMTVVAAVVIGLIAYFVACGKAPFYYHVSFKVNNIDYDSKFAKSYSQEYLDLNKKIVSLDFKYYIEKVWGEWAALSCSRFEWNYFEFLPI